MRNHVLLTATGASGVGSACVVGHVAEERLQEHVSAIAPPLQAEASHAEGGAQTQGGVKGENVPFTEDGLHGESGQCVQSRAAQGRARDHVYATDRRQGLVDDRVTGRRLTWTLVI